MLYPEAQIRLEVPLSPREYADIVVVGPDDSAVVIELKYLTRKWSGPVAGEQFALKNHSALDLRRYDVMKDIRRVEQFIAERPGWSGYVVTLANDAGYWTPPRGERVSNDSEFRIHDGVVINPGPRGWASKTASTRKREAAIHIGGTYALRWADYTTLDASIAGAFRYLIVPVSLSE
ncbi:hypothetical protein GCM10025869_24780 [Homoserinibacter gongjuensis]|uniref:Nuclease-like protein n=1 Tax=Homoserinibacter gongjuensis TaxID=1162968 RepID=A0ABQ6JVC0_9MICO|nr:hypothetical protein GCM10025869_24780 [Homoserinibacter gongjuensis]